MAFKNESEVVTLMQEMTEMVADFITWASSTLSQTTMQYQMQSTREMTHQKMLL